MIKNTIIIENYQKRNLIITNPIAQIKSIVSKQKSQKKNKGGGMRLGMDPGGAGSMNLLLPIFVGFLFLLVAIIGLIYALISALIN